MSGLQGTPRAARHRRPATRAHPHATRMARILAGPAATACPAPVCGARDAHGVDWSTDTQLGWLVTAWNVAVQFAAAAAPSSTAAGAAALVRKPASRRGSTTTATMG